MNMVSILSIVKKSSTALVGGKDHTFQQTASFETSHLLPVFAEFLHSGIVSIFKATVPNSNLNLTLPPFQTR